MKRIVFCISLVGSPRRAVFQDHARRQGLEFNFLDATTPDDLRAGFHPLGCTVDLTDLSWVRHEQNDRRRDQSPLRLSEIACAYSHIRAWQIAHALNVDELFVFEDDAKILRSLQAVHCDDTVDILYLSDRVGRTPSGEALDGCGTEGYLLSRQGLEKCLHIFRKLYMPVDLQLMAHQVSWANHRRGLAQFRQRLPEESYLNAMAVAAPYCTHDDHSSSTIE